MEKENFLLDSVWQLEVAQACLDEDIDFLHCIDEEYFEGDKEESAAYLYWQLKSIIRTLTKSLECTSMNMKKSIDAIYENKKNQKEGVA